MKKLLVGLILAVSLIFASTVWANPFLVCDPQPDTDEFVVVIDGVQTIVPYQETVIGGDTVVVLADLAGIEDGNHTVSVKAKNIWGESSPSPFLFSKILPSVPGQIDIKP